MKNPTVSGVSSRASMESGGSSIDPSLEDTARLIVQGTDRPGIVSRITSVLSELGANIASLNQYTSDPEGGRFFQRTVFTLPQLATRIDELRKKLAVSLDEIGMEWRLVEAKKRKRVAVFASKSDHCLLDLLWRQRRGELPVNITMVISNHPDLSEDVRSFEIPYFYVPVEKGKREEAEARHLELLEGNVDLVVLARYMQILTETFIDNVGVPVINIHHSFLPAFIGAGPYRKAKERGVKLIGATAHYVTKDLDEGPIIAQDVIHVTHKESTTDLQRMGADVERRVLSSAVEAHCEDRVLRDDNVTVVL